MRWLRSHSQSHVPIKLRDFRQLMVTVTKNSFRNSSVHCFVPYTEFSLNSKNALKSEKNKVDLNENSVGNKLLDIDWWFSPILSVVRSTPSTEAIRTKASDKSFGWKKGRHSEETILIHLNPYTTIGNGLSKPFRWERWEWFQDPDELNSGLGYEINSISYCSSIKISFV